MALRAFQTDRCGVCGSQVPTEFDVRHDETAEGLHRLSAYGYTCRSCKRLVDLAGHNASLLRAAHNYVANPPAWAMLDEQDDERDGGKRPGRQHRFLASRDGTVSSRSAGRSGS